MHLSPGRKLVKTNVLDEFVFVVENGHYGLFTPLPFDLDPIICLDLCQEPRFQVPLEEEPQLVVFVEGSRRAAHDIGRDGIYGREIQSHRDHRNVNREKEED